MLQGQGTESVSRIQNEVGKLLCTIREAGDYSVENRSREQDAELHWLRRALVLIMNLRDFEEYLAENGHLLSEGSN